MEYEKKRTADQKMYTVNRKIIRVPFLSDKIKETLAIVENNARLFALHSKEMFHLFTDEYKKRIDKGSIAIVYDESENPDKMFVSTGQEGEEFWHEMDFGGTGPSLDGVFYAGDTPPEDKGKLWITTQD